MRPAYLVLTGLLTIGVGWVAPSSPLTSVVRMAHAAAPPEQSPAPQTAWLELLKQRQYDQLGERLAALQSRFEAGKCQECEVSKAYYAFATSDPVVGERLDDWVKTRPESLSARLARGIFRHHISHLARGGAYAAQTHPHRFAEMTRLQNGAVEDLLWVVRRNPRMSIAYAELIYIATKQGGDIAAASVYAEATAHNPESSAIFRARAWSLAPWWQGVLSPAAALDRLKAYVADLDHRFAGRPGFEWLTGYADYMDGETRSRAGDLDGAIASFSKAIAAAERPSYLVARAGIYHRKHQDDPSTEERADLDRALEIAPDNTDALADLGRLEGKLCQQAQAAKATDLSICQQASDVLDRVVAKDPLDPDSLTLRALQSYRLGRTDDVRRDLEQARVYGEYDPELQSLAGNLLMLVDRVSAKAAYRRAVAAAPGEPMYVEDYLRFLTITGDCDFLETFKAYKSLCEQATTCRAADTDFDPVQVFEHSRGRSCATETWQEPRGSLVLPD